MKDVSSLKSEEFETLLRWLSDDRDQAGTEYNKIRDGLIRYFRSKGCSDAAMLADETFNRVAAKIPTFYKSENVKKTSIIFGFASNIALESVRNRKREQEKAKKYAAEFEPGVSPEEEDNKKDDVRIKCLNKCLNKISAQERKVFKEYYVFTKEKKAEARKRLAARLDCEINTLAVRVFRLREVLAQCIEKCMEKSS